MQPARKGWYSTPAQHAAATRKEHTAKAKTNVLAGALSSFHPLTSSQSDTALPNQEDKRPTDWLVVDDGDVVEMKRE